MEPKGALSFFIITSKGTTKMKTDYALLFFTAFIIGIVSLLLVYTMAKFLADFVEKCAWRSAITKAFKSKGKNKNSHEKKLRLVIVEVTLRYLPKDKIKHHATYPKDNLSQKEEDISSVV